MNWRLRNRFALAWWAFCNPDNLTMLRHEMAESARCLPDARSYSDNRRIYHGVRCDRWLERFLNLPVR